MFVDSQEDSLRAELTFGWGKATHNSPKFSVV